MGRTATDALLCRVVSLNGSLFGITAIDYFAPLKGNVAIYKGTIFGTSIRSCDKNYHIHSQAFTSAVSSLLHLVLTYM